MEIRDFGFKFLLSVIVFFIVFTPSLLVALYQLPVDSSYITATFMEFRSTGKIPHFHSGIDFSTFLKEGVPIKAAADGFVRRLEIDLDNIYGNTVVLEHPDGYRTLYAHLSAFADKYEKLANMLREEFGSKRIVVEFLSDDLKVSIGELIGYSGRTGEAAQPHCHFEVRDKEERNIYDPLDFIDKKLLKPVQMGIILKDLIIDGKQYPYSENATYEFSGAYPRIAVEAYTELAKNLLGVKEIKVYFSDDLVYHIILDKLPMEYWEKPNLLYDEHTVMTSLVYRAYYKLYSDEDSPFVRVNKVKQYGGSNYKVSLEIKDAFGNVGKFSFNLQRR
ncbi:Peptidase family M23 [Fervidobacterium changbaicum]|uniref:M23 family peptidase n=1 Tax=Fervidobacterium changbaicum TaxID=310769 RepID=A0ABX5QPQ8_9BACT|nr:M23 family metallopeptidase [Fervidobacterium changbaicum]QAV32450.1 M23 family peptidase [Fervidobacterium changbaicum]SDH19957.1 Peptidase family M23 [Fervidobacterium changbaicum]